MSVKRSDETLEFQTDKFAKVHECSDGFSNFCESVEKAIEELERIETEQNRIQLQKLVYVHLVNNFDYTVDQLLLFLSINNETVRNQVLKTLQDEPVFLKDVYEVFLTSDSPQIFVERKMQDRARLKLLNGGHYEKVRTLTKSVEWEDVDKTFVALSGTMGKIKKRGKLSLTTPNSIIGFADYLYSKRNSVVHGNGIDYTDKDAKRLKEVYHTNRLPKKFKLSIASIKTTITFYKSFMKEYTEKLESIG